MAIRNATQVAQPVGPAPELPSTYPTIPPKLAKIDPELEKYHSEQERLYRRIREALSLQNTSVAKAAAESVKTTTSLSTRLVQLGAAVTNGDAELSAAIVAEAGIRQTQDGLLATSITSLSASANGQFATINETLSAQATFNGQLTSTYTLTATAGNVITGMRLVSSTGPAGNVSAVIFQADRFTIFNGASAIPVFDLNGSNVRIGGVTIDSGAGDKLYIGSGNYANADTAFYVDSTGRMSLKDRLVWDGSTLAVNGSITATSGTIGGLSAASDKLYLGAGAYNDATTPFYVDNAGRFSLSNKFSWSGSTLSITGSVNVTSNDGLNVTGLGGRIEMQAFPSSIAPSVIRFYDSANQLRSVINSDGSMTALDSAGVARVTLNVNGLVTRDSSGAVLTTVGTTPATASPGLPPGYTFRQFTVCSNGSLVSYWWPTWNSNPS